MPFKATEYIWYNAELVPWAKATVHVMTHALHYGSSVFEGIRAYNTPDGPALFRLEPHLRRLYDSAKIYRMAIPYTPERLAAACHTVVSANKLTSAYLRPLVWYGYGDISPAPHNTPVEVMSPVADCPSSFTSCVVIVMPRSTKKVASAVFANSRTRAL